MFNRRSVWIGFDPREADGFAVTRQSLSAAGGCPYPIKGIVLPRLQDGGLYSRPMERRDGRLWDVVSGAPMATEFAISRFFTPLLAGGGWALFMDSDMLIRRHISDLFAYADPKYAVMVVKHVHRPAEGTKMDGQAQIPYERKNWSSVILFNCDHPANAKLTPQLLNSAKGLFLHQFRWLEDDLIGDLPTHWNWLNGYSSDAINPSLVHFTEGIPSMPGYENVPYADEWRGALRSWAAQDAW